jgi:hypothetical protein
MYRSQRTALPCLHGAPSAILPMQERSAQRHPSAAPASPGWRCCYDCYHCAFLSLSLSLPAALARVWIRLACACSASPGPFVGSARAEGRGDVGNGVSRGCWAAREKKTKPAETPFVPVSLNAVNWQAQGKAGLEGAGTGAKPTGRFRSAAIACEVKLAEALSKCAPPPSCCLSPTRVSLGL